jgi:Na+-transporting methylmalonyl-CoA/oxaloacetate decarboxylase gamma subunit
MSFEGKVQLSLIVMLTGLVVVFVMLIFLTFIIKGYGVIVKGIQEKSGVKSAVQAAPAPMIFAPAEKSVAATVPVIQSGIPDEVVAAISAAVYTMYGTSAGTVTSICRATRANRSEWTMAGLLENTRPF